MDELTKRLISYNQGKQNDDYTDFKSKYQFWEIPDLYKAKFNRNNRWNKKLTCEFYEKLSDVNKTLFVNVFNDFFRLNKTNNEFLRIINKCDGNSKVPIPKHELNILINTLGYFYQSKILTVPSKKLAKIIFDSFQSNYQLSTIEDKIRLHKKSDPLGEISIKIDRRFTELQNEVNKYFSESKAPKSKITKTLLQKKSDNN